MLDSNKDNLKLDAMKRIVGVSHPNFIFFQIPYLNFLKNLIQ